MIPEKVIWVRFPAWISTVYIKLLPINDLVFQFLIKYLHICCYKFSYRISNQEIRSAMPFRFCNFPPTFSFFEADLAILRKMSFKVIFAKL